MQTKFLMQLNLIIYLFYYFFIVSSCFKQIFDQKRSTKKKIYIYITKTSQKQFGRKFNYIGLFNIFSIIFKC